MAWLRGSFTWSHRAPIAVDNSGGSATSQYVTVVVASDMEEFWANVNQTDGRDVRVTDATGSTVIAYELSGFSYANRTLTINIGPYTAPAGAVYQLWLYWGSSTATSGSVTVTTSTPKTGYIELGKPTELSMQVRPENAGETRPRNAMAKPSTDTDWIWWDLRYILQQYLAPVANFIRLEEVSYISYVVNAGDTSQSGMIDATKTRYIDGWVRTLVKAGTSGTDYTAVLTITTSLGRTITARSWLKVRDVTEIG